MADKSINDLPAVESLADDGLLPVYQDGGAKRLSGELLRSFAKTAGAEGASHVAKGDKGDKGAAGSDGITPHIGTNGNWYIGSMDTGKPSRGDPGAKGDPGSAGSDGISPVVSVETISGGHRITITDAERAQSFDVLDGASGSGSGDMAKAVYDPKGKAQDIFSYADTKYSKPSGGIPKKDLASAVQTSLGKADSALQSVPSTYRTASAQDTIDNGKQAKITASGLLKGNGSGSVSAAVKGTDYAAPSVGVSVTLRASGWDADAKTQTVSVAGVTATANCIITAAPDSYMVYAEAGVRCTAQGAGTLTFACETVPTANVAANVLILG